MNYGLSMLSETVKLDILFKIFNEKVSSTLTKNFFEEAKNNKRVLNSERVATQANLIPTTPAVVPSLVAFHDIELTHDSTVSGKKSWNAGVLGDFIPPVFGSGYEIKIYDDDGAGNKGNRIYPTDPSGWFFFYDSGQLTFYGDNSSHNASSGSLNYHAEIYQYIGEFGASGGGDSPTNDVNQVAHGLAIGELIYRRADDTYQKAISDPLNDEMSDAVGIVIDVQDADNFTYQYLMGHYIKTTGTFPVGNAGDAVFLSNSVAGEMTTTVPSTIGDISKPVGIILVPDTKMILFYARGIILSSVSGSPAPSGEQIFDYYVTENDFDDLKSAVSNSAYKSIFIPNGTYTAPATLVGDSALVISDDEKLLYGESRDGVIIDLNLAPANIINGIEITSSNVHLENFTLRNLLTNISVDVYGIKGNASRFIGNNLLIESVTNSTNPAYGIYRMRNSSAITVSLCTIGISDVIKSSNISVTSINSGIVNSTGLTNVVVHSNNGVNVNGCRNISNISITGSLPERAIINSSGITNVRVSNRATASTLFEGVKGISNVYLSEVGSLGNNVSLFSACSNVANVYIRENWCENLFNNCKGVSNVFIEDGSLYTSTIEEAVLESSSQITNVHVSSSNVVKNFAVNSSELSNISIYGLSDTAFTDSRNISNIFVLNALGETSFVGTSIALRSNNLSNMYIYQSIASVVNTIGFNGCKGITNIYTDDYNDGVTTHTNQLYDFIYYANGVSNCYARNVVHNAYTSVDGISGCTAIADPLTGNGRQGFLSCDTVSNCVVEGFQREAMRNCNYVTNCFVKDNQQSILGRSITDAEIENCTYIKGLKIDRDSSLAGIVGLFNCSFVSDSSIGTNVTDAIVIGARSTNNIFNSIIYVQGNDVADRGVIDGEVIIGVTVDASGGSATHSLFESCTQLTSCKAIGQAKTFGFNACEQIDNSKAVGGNKGFLNSIQVSNCKAEMTGGNDGFDGCDYVSNCIMTGGSSGANTNVINSSI